MPLKRIEKLMACDLFSNQLLRIQFVSQSEITSLLIRTRYIIFVTFAPLPFFAYRGVHDGWNSRLTIVRVRIVG